MYRLTIIDTKYLIAIVGFGVLTGLASLSLLVKSSYHAIWSWLIKSIVGAALACSAVLFTNQQFADEEITVESFQIKSKGSFSPGKYGHCSQPYVIIDYHGIDKQITF